jgi:hypothetical protein
MRQSAADKDVNTEADESASLEGNTKQRLLETQQIENTYLVRAIVNCRACKLITELQLIVVTGFKSSINPVANPKPVCSHLTRGKAAEA